MSSAFRGSKYKHAVGKPQKKELWYPDLRPNTNSSDVSMIKASNRFIAVNWSSASATVAVLNLDQPGKRKGDPYTIHVGGQLGDFDFSPFDDTLLGTGADDAHIKMWKIPEDLSQPLSSPQTDLTGHKRSVDTLAFHPVANHVLASGSADKTVKLWDVEKAQERATFEMFGDAVQSVCWNYDGSLLAVASKDKKIRTIDPRANSLVSEGEGHPGLKAMKLVWLGNTPRFLSTGFSKTRERQYAIWDATDLSKPLKMTTLDSSTGVINPIYDADTNLLFLAGGGDSTVRAFEITDDKGLISDLTTVAGDLPQKGVAWVPKRSVDVMDTEVARLLRLTTQAIVPVSFNVPRKFKSKFADDLFPDTPGPHPALSADQWFAGETKTPILVSLDPEKRSSASASSTSAAASSSSSSSSSSASSSAGPAIASAVSAGFSSSPASSPALQRAAEAGASPSAGSPSSSSPNVNRTGIVPKVVRSSKYRHIQGKPVKKTQYYDNVKAHGATSNTVVKANTKFFAVPWTGTGGLLAVIPHSMTGRLPASVPCFETGSTLLDFDTHPFNESIVATGDEMAHIKIWTVPEEGLFRAGAKNISTPTTDIVGHTRKITTLNFHPSADNVLLSTSADLTLRTWDIERGAEIFNISGHSDLVLGTSINYQGNLVLTTCRDKIMRVIDVRANSMVTEVQGHLGVKGSRATWLGNTPNIFSVGFGKSSEREYSLWDSRSLAAPILTRSIDQLSGVITPYYDEDIGVIYLAGRGDGSIKMYEIVDNDVHYLTEYGSNVPQMGIAPLPKQMLDVRQCEIARFLKVSDNNVEPIQMLVPRQRMEFFQDDIFPLTRAMSPTMTTEEWVSGGETRDPKLESLKPEGMGLLSEAPAVEKKSSASMSSARAVDNTPSPDQVISSFYKQITLNFKEDENTQANSAHDGDEDDEWA